MTFLNKYHGLLYVYAEIKETFPAWTLHLMKRNPINQTVYKHRVTSSYHLFFIHPLHLQPHCSFYSTWSSHLTTYNWGASSFLSTNVWKKHLRETTLGCQFSPLPKFSNLLQSATNNIKREHHSWCMLNTHSEPVPNEGAEFWQCGKMAGEMALLEGPYFTNLAKLCFKVISKCSSCAEQHAWSSTSMAPGQPISHCWSEPSVERQPASESDGL